MIIKSTVLVGTISAAVLGASVRLASADTPTGDSKTAPLPGSQADKDDFTVTPELVTPTESAGSPGQTTTLALDYNYKKTWEYGTSLADQDRSCTTSSCSSWLRSWNAQASASGKLAANSHVNVGDLIDFTGSAGYESYHLPVALGPGPNDGVSAYGDIDVSAKASYEAGQRLSTHQYTYGISALGYGVPGGATSWHRYLTFPTVVLEFARVNPTNDTARKAVDPGLESYNRAHVRIGTGFVIPDAFRGRDLKFGYRYDYWRELSPSAAIVNADLDRQNYRAYSVTLPGTGTDADWVVTYSSGSVPTDQASAKIWQLGWAWKFK